MQWFFRKPGFQDRGLRAFAQSRSNAGFRQLKGSVPNGTNLSMLQYVSVVFSKASRAIFFAVSLVSHTASVFASALVAQLVRVCVAASFAQAQQAEMHGSPRASQAGNDANFLRRH